MNRKLLIIPAVSFLLSGCDQLIETIFDSLSGTERNVTILANTPIQISPTSTDIELTVPAVVVGKTASICLSLLGNVPMADQQSMDDRFDSVMKGASLTVLAYSTDGKTLEFSRPGQSWSRNGKIEPINELSACVNAECGEDIPKGTKFDKFSIITTKPINVEGVYWKSTNAWD